jgi:predicted RNase H-like nuclease
MALEAHNARYQQQREDALTAAYLGAYWQRVKRMPRLEEVLADLRPKSRREPQSSEDMLRTVKRLQARIGKEG